MIDWMPHARRLSDALADSGSIRGPVWHRVFSAVPRHEFVPFFFEQIDAWKWERVDGADPAQRDRWAAAVYSDTTLVTALVHMTLPDEYGGGTFPIAVSSSTAPGLMARMLEDLDVQDGHRVLEIGTGTGYNAALLSERLGDQQVCSVDLRPELVDLARDRLAAASYRPTLAAGNGIDGLAEHGPFDRIISTCGVAHVPPAWIEQLRPGGLLLTDVKGAMAGGNLAALRRIDKHTVQGRFCTPYGGFMPMQHQLGIEPAEAPTPAGPPTERGTELSPQTVHQHDQSEQLVIQLHLPPGTQLRLTHRGATAATRLVSPDGSWCEVTHAPEPDGRHLVSEAGPHPLWRLAEQAHRRHLALGEPGWDRFGITATAVAQRVWLDTPDGDLTWPIDLSRPP